MLASVRPANARSPSRSTIAAAVMVIGLAFQTVTHKDEEERLNEKAEAREKKARARDAAERAKRFAGYGKPK